MLTHLKPIVTQSAGIPADWVRSEHLLRLTSRLAPIGTWHFEIANGRMVWSDEACRIFEKPPGTSPSLLEATAFYAPEWRARMSKRLDECMGNGTSYDARVQVTTADGHRVWVRATGEPVRDANNIVTGAQGAFQDLSEQMQAEERASHLTMRFTNTLDSITDAFYTLDREWRFTYLNKEASRLMQRPDGDLLTKVLWEEFGDLSGQMAYKEFHRAIRENCTVVFEEYYPPFQLWSEIRAFPSEEGLAVHSRDITEAKKFSEALRESEERFKTVARSIPDAIYDWDLASGKLWRSEKMREMFGYSTEDFEGGIQTWSSRVHPEDKDRLLQVTYGALAGLQTELMEEYRFMRKDGSWAHVQDRASILRDPAGKAIRFVGAMVDLSERKRAEELQKEADTRIREQASLLDKAKDAIVVSSVDNLVRFWNKGAERLYGWTAEEAIGRSFVELLHGDPAMVHEAYREVLQKGEWTGETIERHKDGSPLQVEVNWTLVRDENGEPKTIFAIKSDISRRKLAEHNIRHLAFYDTLTGLPNRRMLMEKLQTSLDNGTYREGRGALLFIDLDNFKTLNDTWGHAFGDLLLQQVARCLSACVRSCDTVARLGGDEFVIILENLGSGPEVAVEQASVLGSKILAALNQPFQLGDYDHYTTASVGITFVDDDQRDIGELLKRADLAMYQSKSAGRNTMRFFDPNMQAAVAIRAALEVDVRRGLRESQFVLLYQPQVDKYGRMVGVEALVRWRHPARGMISPAEFIPLVEETGLILPLGQWALETACTQLACWSVRREMQGVEMAVNVSSRQFRHPDFVEQVLAILVRTGVNPRLIKLELTESLLVDNFEDTIAKMHLLKARGVGFSLDDFGTGYSSLTYLKRLPLDVLKIDRSFLRDVLSEPHNAILAKTIIALGQSLGLLVIAEGVETEEQRDFLAQQGCNVYQGYLFSAPLSTEQIDDFAAACFENTKKQNVQV
jgi:diguanylate cyclase (GGDEF)-like protein/PAS domain S-box-containing protein